jgi:PAS domain S-box-containing protein
MITIDEIQRAGVAVRNITLSPLDITNVNRLIADALICRMEKSKPLAELVHNKTRGNPFFVKAFLQSLYDEKLLTFAQPHTHAAREGWWQWDMKKIYKLQVASNVADLFVKRINQFSESAVEIMKLAACLGNNFSLEALSILTQQTQEEIILLFQPALSDGMIFQLNGRYYFVHDRVQEAAYSMIPEVKQKEMHLRIGRLMLEHSRKKQLEENIFDILSHLNAGRTLITDLDEKIKLAELNLESSKWAKDSAAYDVAQRHLSIGMELIPEDGWENYYELTYAIYYARAEAEFLVGNFEQADSLYKLILDNAKSNLEKGSVYVLQINQLCFKSKYPEAIEIGINALKLLGMRFPKVDEHLMSNVETLFKDIFVRLGDLKVESLINLLEAEDPVIKAQIEILSALLPLTYYVDPRLLAYCAGSIVNLSIKHGNSPTSPAGYSFFAVLLVSQGSYELGHQFGTLGLTLAEKYQIGPQIAMACHMFSTCINHWRKPIKTNLAFAQRGYQVGLESGDLQWSCYTRYPLAITNLYIGTHLKDFIEILRNCHSVGEKYKNQIVPQVLKPLRQFALNLKGETKDKSSFDSQEFNEIRFLGESQTTALMSIAWFHGLKLRLQYLYENYSEALGHAADAAQFLQYCPGQLIIFDFHFYRALARLALYQNAPEEQKDQQWEEIEADQALVKIWRDNCPENFDAQCFLVEAEKLRVLGKITEAMELYEKAIECARNQRDIQNEALSDELYAKFWLTLGRDKIAAMYMREAIYQYERWGAITKTEDLEERYGEMISNNLTGILGNEIISPKISHDISTGTGTESLDLMTVIKASQAISSEITLEKLLERIIMIIVENAGAQKGFLILKSEEQAYIEAAAEMDSDKVEVLQSIPVDQSRDLCRSIVNYVIRSGKNVILHNALYEGAYTEDPDIKRNEIRSVLCAPFQYKDKTYGVLYLENNLVPQAFSEERIKLLQVLLTQAAISMENAELFERSALFQKYVEESSEGLGWTDIDGTLRYANTTLSHMLGETNPEDTYGKPIFEYYSEEVQQRLQEEIFPIVLRKGAWTGELVLHIGKGILVPTMASFFLLRDAEGNPLCIANVVTDITERKRAEEALRDSEQKYRLLAENISDIIWTTDMNMRFTYVSPSVKRQRGYSAEEAMALSIEETLTPSSCELAMDIFSQELALEESGEEYDRARTRTIEVEQLCRDGSTVWGEVTASFLWGKGGKPVGVLGVTRDISERKQAGEEKANLEKQLQQAQKMEAIGTLAGGIAHDFNNILYSIMGNTEMTIEDVPEGSLARSNMERVLKATKRAKDLVKQILAFSRQSRQERKPLKVQTILEETLQMLRSSLPTTIEIQQDIDMKCGPVLADPTQIHQVIMNLCTNAYHAMREKGGKMGVTLTEVNIDSDDFAPTLGFKLGPYLKLTVSDTGHGMGRQVMDRVFDPFFTTKGPGEGAGMGLSVVHGIVKNHGGDIRVYSEPGEGTQFEVYLPLVESSSVALEAVSTESVPKGKEHILLVDDEEEIIRIVRQMLERLGYSVTSRTSSVEALEAFRELKENFDLVITDQTMPNMTGDELAKRLIRIRPDIPIILCTGFSERISEEKTKAIGIREYIMKPILKSEMAKAIRRVLDQEEREMNHARILIIDDDVEIRVMLRNILEHTGYEVVDAPDGKVAMRLHRNEPADLIITDLIMPKKEGIETIVELKRDFPEVKIIAISGGGSSGPKDYLSIAKQMGAMRIFTKPLEQDVLLEAVRELLS